MTITTDEELGTAIDEIQGIIRGQSLDDLPADVEARLEELALAVGDYEDEHYPIPAVAPGAILRHLLDCNDLTPMTLSLETGVSAEKIAAFVAGTDTLTDAERVVLSNHFCLCETAFLPESSS